MGGAARSPCDFLDFGAVPVGSSATQTVNVSNSGCPPIMLSASIFQDGGAYVLGPVPSTLQLGQDAGVIVTFSPVDQSAPQGQLVFTTNDPDGGPVSPPASSTSRSPARARPRS